MTISSRTPEGWPNRCPVCGVALRIEPSTPTNDAPCPACGSLVWFRHNSSKAIGTACLVHVYPTGPGMGTRYPLRDTPVVLGRDADCHIHLADDSVSHKHACVQPEGDGYAVLDLNSINGTHINGARVNAHKLKDGDYLHVGNAIFRYLSGGNVEAAYHEEIYRLTIIDALTGVHNKRYLLEFLGHAISLAVRHRKHLSFLMCDIDRFKSINDVFGLTAGDHVLREIARRMKMALGKEDLLARYGGEEFAVVLPDLDSHAAAERAEHIRVRVASEPLSCPQINRADSMCQVPATLSIGVASIGFDDWITTTELIRRADAKLHEAKCAGRNRVVA